jgi:signal transduction histidine kinase/ligand-binding sensor domain-containing protein
MNGERRKRTPAILAALLTVTFIPVVSARQDAEEADAQRAHYGVDVWREAEGLPQSRIRDIAQTRDGYLWLATDNGVVRFNGASFTAFIVEPGGPRDNEVWALQEDDEGGLWIGSYGGLTLLKGGRFTTFTRANGLPDDVVTMLDKDREGNIWIATPAGAARYSRGSFTKFTTEGGLPNNDVTALCADSPFGVLIATRTKLSRFANGKFQTVDGLVAEGDGQIEHLLCGRDGSLWIAFHNAVIKRWKDGALATYTRHHNLTPHIYGLHEDSQGVLWVALQQGLYQLKSGKFEPVPLGAKGAGLGVITSLCADREGSLWIGLESNGLARLRIKHLKTLAAEDGLPGDSTRSVFQDSRGNIWIGTVGGLAKYRNGRVETYTDVAGARLGIIRSLAEDSRGVLWVGASQELLLMKNGRLTSYPGWKSVSEIKVIYRDALGRMWVGTDGDGLFLFDRDKVRVFRASDGLASNQIRALYYDRRGALWIGAAGAGVSRYADGAFKTYTTADGLAGNRVYAIHEDEDGSLWMATREGLSRFKDGRFFNFTVESGLLANFLYSILDDGRGNFWFSCAQGVFRVGKDELRAFAEGKIRKVKSFDYGIRDGMKTRTGNPGNQPTAWKAADGSLLFCTLQGVVIADPTRMATSEFAPPVYIEQALINKQSQPMDGEPAAPVGAGEVEIHFAALSYIAPERIRYQYKLTGFDQDWVDAGTRRFAYYANLAPGRYRFQVKAGNLDGPWNETGATFSFYLQPRFYQTQLFFALVALAVLLLAGLLYRLRMHEVKARYSAVLAERNRIAGEIHDTLAQNLAGIALQLDSVAMHLADAPAGLRERLDQACNLTRYSLSEARRAVADLRSDELEQRELAAALPEIAGKLTAAATLQTRVEVVGAPRRLNPVVEKNLLRIFQEAVANAVKHARARNLEVELSYGADCLTLRVRDDGCGFDTDKIIPLGVGHYGLTGMRERAERIGGRLILKSKPGEGTELSVEAPF